MSDRPRRKTADKQVVLSSNNCNKCKLIQRKEVLLQKKMSKDGFKDSNEFELQKKRLTQLKNHICNNQFVNLEDYSDDEIVDEAFLIQRHSDIRRSSRKRKPIRNSDYIFEDYKEKSRVMYQSKLIKHQQQENNDSESSDMEDDHDRNIDDYIPNNFQNKAIK